MLRAAAQHDGWVGLLDRFGRAIEIAYGVVLAREGEGGIGEKALYDLHSFCQATDAYTCRIQGDGRLIIVASPIACAHAEVQTAAGEKIDGGGFLRQIDGMAEITAEDKIAHTQRGRGGGVSLPSHPISANWSNV